MSCKVNHCLGQKPVMWNREVIFFANILSLFFGNHKESNVLCQEVGALETYGSRLIPILNLMYQSSHNLLILEREPEHELLKYFRDTLDLSLPQFKIIPHHFYDTFVDHTNVTGDIERFLKELEVYPAQWFDGYVTDDIIKHIAQKVNKKTICLNDGSKKGNNKFLLHHFLAENQLPVFDTVIADKKENIAESLDRLRKMGYNNAVVKAAIGASGIGLKKVSLQPEITVDISDFDDYLFYEGACLVQGWLDDSVSGVHYLGSPSVQIFVEENQSNLYDLTDQILSVDSIHEGNYSPATCFGKDESVHAELLRQAEIVVGWLHQQGYRGPGSIDFHLVRRNNATEVRVCEVNARVTGATYPSILAQHFQPGNAWLMRNIRFSNVLSGREILDTLKDANLLYDPNGSVGILPFNFNPTQEGNIAKGQFLFLGKDSTDTSHLLKQLTELQMSIGGFDRD